MTQRQKKKEPASWQERGYRMEDTECEHEPPINDQNDTGYLHGDRNGWDGDPFDDSAVDEQLRKERSEELELRKSEFWDNPEHPPEGSGIERSRRKAISLDGVKDRIRSLNKRTTVAVVAALVLLVVGVLVGVRMSLRVRTVHVSLSGDLDQRYSGEPTEALEERILAAIGGTDIRGVDEERIRREVAKDPYLSLISVKTEMPSTVNLSIRVRNVYAWMEWHGDHYTIDGYGMVLEKLDASVVPALPEVKLNVYKCIPGRKIELNNPQDLENYCTVTMEIRVLGLNTEIEEYYLINPDDLMLKTRDGYYVSLGKADRIHAKLRSMMLVREKLAETGRTGGTIYVGTPEKPTWSP